MSALLAAKFCGAATLIAVDIDQSRLALARDLGATHTVNSKNEDAVAAVKAITHGGVDFALESTGRPEVLKHGVDAWAHSGKIAVVGAPALGTTAQFDVNDLLLGGKTIVGRGRRQQRAQSVYSRAGGFVYAGQVSFRQAD